MNFKIFASLALVQLVAAQYGYPPTTPTTATTAAAASTPSIPPNSPGQWNIEVAAGNQFVFGQPNITAKVGDNVTWHFPNNGIEHSVTQSSFNDPCVRLAASGNNTGGFDSTLTAGTTFTIMITDTNPIWYHCKQIMHCGMGMVGSINAPSSGNTYDSFLAAAKAIGQNEQLESDTGTPVLTGVGAVATAGPMSATAGGGSGGSGAGASSGNSANTSGALRHFTESGWYLATALIIVSVL
ncbi:hypothetical protein AGABI2DRAFT_190750 [Agaricus bisporus var. bisporus H97]|uniref:hypothetical protein n=1 Tax=Agaricus bisporus var. bisporus (strain H97 / ATCC MYA-4626 / FGSC 10389) TaxID=936046 RepID=UPI00029F6951|nr:hypothetical protein AGABI2DRAFT_190750 [Agaricus bisporus var. bisporus H97]EKV50423.1 hypothetical protein AGABI2DRAFT_190750 [Agaricus bisporus var. bisporus H97]